MILLVVLYVRNLVCYIKGEHRLRGFDRELGRIFASEREEVGKWRQEEIS
jgi:hypothetical protein